VVGEGAAMFVLEDLEHARARGARVHAEVVGFGSNCDGAHVTRPMAGTMQRVMELALADASLPPGAIGYVNGHGTATEHGDVAETRATAAVLGSRVPISSQKSYLGHTLGACGAIEAWLTVEMMRGGWHSPTLNLDSIDPACGELDYILGDGRDLDIEFAMSNNFAFGGVNTSLVLRRGS
jgi:3-oxoacyl-[acyl-carrier-protein] synthase II